MITRSRIAFTASLVLAGSACAAHADSDSSSAQASSSISPAAPAGAHAAPTLFCAETDTCDATNDCSDATAQVNAAFNNNVVGFFSSGQGVEFDYCVAGTLECRSLLLQNTTGVPTPFSDNFTASRRFVSSAGYFLPNADGTFRVYLDQTWDGKVNVDLAWTDNQAVAVTFDAQGLPTMHNFILKTLGTTKFIIADLTYADDQATLIGTQYDETDPTVATPFSKTYVRIRH